MVAGLIVLGLLSLGLYAAGIVTTVVEGCPDGRGPRGDGPVRGINNDSEVQSLLPIGIECGPDGETFEANPELRWASYGSAVGFVVLLVMLIRSSRSRDSVDGDGPDPLDGRPTA